MYLPRFLVFFSLFATCICSVFAAGIETFYFDKQKAYRVDAVVAGELFLKEAEPSEVAEYEGERIDTWWVRGELPLDASYASLLPDYEIRNQPNPFKRRHEALQSSVRVAIPKWATTQIENDEGWDAFVIVAWVHEGLRSHYHVIDSNNIGRRGGLLEFEIPTEKVSGMPVVWVVKAGQVLASKDVKPWNLAAFSSEYQLERSVLALKERDGRGVLHYAAVNGLSEYAGLLVERHPDLVNQKDERQYTANWYAVRNGREPLVALLIAAGAPAEEGEFEDSVLARAARNGHLGVVKQLALRPAKRKKDKRIYNWALSSALLRNHAEIIFYLLEQGAEFKIAESQYAASVLRAFSSGFPDIAFLLMDELKVKADVQNNGYGLLHSVAPYADVALLERVAKTGADLGLMTDKGLLPADFAIGLGNVEAICWFYDNASESLGRPDGIDPLTHAIKEGQLDSVECLLGYGVDVNKQVGPGISPAMYATFLGKYDIAQSLVNKGGRWILDGEYLSMIVSKLVAEDEVELVASLIEQGWNEQTLIASHFKLSEAAAFFKADKVLKDLQDRGWEIGESRVKTVGSVETKPRVLNGLNLKYPEKLQEKFGEKMVETRLALTKDGIPVLARAQLEEDEEALRMLVEDAVLRLRFDPARVADAPVSVSLAIRVPLNVDFNPADVLNMADVDEKPHALTRATPLYPYSMQQSRKSGRVVVEFVISADGAVHKVRPVEASHDAFIEPALECVIRSRWAPAKYNGRAVACRVRIPIEFMP